MEYPRYPISSYFHNHMCNIDTYHRLVILTLTRPLDWDCARSLCLLTVASHFIPRNYSRVLTWLSIRFKIRAAIHLCSVLSVIDAKLHERRHYLVTCILHIARSIAVSSAKICIEENRDKGKLYEGAANYSWAIINSRLKADFYWNLMREINRSELLMNQLKICYFFFKFTFFKLNFVINK